MNLLEESWQKAVSYADYKKLIVDLRAINKNTGNNHSDEYLNYTDLNINRMNKWDKHFKPNPHLIKTLQNLSHQELWLVLTEGWCGDAAHAVPMLHKLTQFSNKVEMRLILRDENLELMDQYLTNGGRSIPKLIRLKANSFEYLGGWGPRPKEAQNLMISMKAEGEEKHEINRLLQIWYARDKGVEIQKELFADINKKA